MLIELSEVSLEAQFHSSTKPNSKSLILSHPHPLFGGTMTNKVIDQIYRRSVERDWSVLRYNTRGTGKSTGTHDKGIAETRDLEELVGWALKQPNFSSDHLILIGYSFGSWLTAKVAAKLQKPCVLIAPAVTMYPFPVEEFAQNKIILSAEKDELIPIQKTKEYVDSLLDPKTHIMIPGADHYFIGTTTTLIREVFRQLDTL